ncbi:MAG TPA: SPOR domain-containing protein [Gammaproteobacteria bacterium]|nr:SPOR domain-containing protein [Gammaproteobacteria bacterium]
MARDYKHRGRRRRRKSAPSPWLWALTGVVVGLFVAFLVFLQIQPKPSTGEISMVLEKPAPQDTRVVRKPEPKAPPPPQKPRFDFYDILPSMEVVVPEEEIRGTPTHEGVRRVERPGTYLLQAGSFRRRKQADQLRARLAMLGMETSIQSVSVAGNQTWHRVRVGPFSNLRELNRARGELKKNGIDTILIRLKK